MPRLPDITSLGERPVPRTSLGRTSYQPTSGKEGAVGQALTGVSNVLQQISADIERENLRADTLRAEDAFNQLRAKQMELTRGEDGFANKRGGDAVNTDIVGEYGKRFDAATNEIAETLTNDRQKALLRKRADIAGLEYRQDMLNHVTREKDAYAKQTFQGIIDTETSNAIERYKDPNGTALSLERINAAITSEAQRTGAAPELVQAMRRDMSSRVLRGIIERHLANDDDLSATAKYEKIKGALNSEDTIAVERALEVGSTRGQAQRNADRIMEKHGNEFGIAVEEAKKIKNPKVREATLNNIRQAKNDNEAAIKLAEDEAFTSGMQYVQQYGDVNKIPPSDWVRIGPDGHAALEKMAAEVKEKRVPVTDQKKWSEFNEKSKDRNWLAGLSEKEFSGYLFNFDEEKRDRASALRDAAKKAAAGDPKAKEFLRNDVSLKRLVAAKVVEAGLIPANRKTADMTQEEEAILSEAEARASSELEKIAIRQGSKATVDQEREVVNKLVLENAKAKVKGTGIFGSSFFETQKPVREMTPAEKANIKYDYKSVPITKRDQIKARAAKLGVDTTGLSEDTIAEAYTAFMSAQYKGIPIEDAQSIVDAILRRK